MNRVSDFDNAQIGMLRTFDIKCERFGIQQNYYNEHNFDRKIVSRYPKVRVVVADRWHAPIFMHLQKLCKNDWIWDSPLQTDYTDYYFIHQKDADAFSQYILVLKLKYPNLSV